jgi:hypothetical protein
MEQPGLSASATCADSAPTPTGHLARRGLSRSAGLGIPGLAPRACAAAPGVLGTALEVAQQGSGLGRSRDRRQVGHCRPFL